MHPSSRQQLRSRLRQHYRGNAAGSTLRLTLGCLLASQLGLQLRRVGRGQRLTFADGEQVLSGWMGRCARVCWLSHPRPWELEQALVARLDLPLNLHGNSHHRFYPNLRSMRAGLRQLMAVQQVGAAQGSRIARALAPGRPALGAGRAAAGRPSGETAGTTGGISHEPCPQPGP